MTDTARSHERRPLSLSGFPDTEARLSAQPTRLLVFVHGWNGRALKTWRHFDDESCDVSEWWCASDLLFIGYASRKRDPAGVADQLRDVLLAAYPRRPAGWMVSRGKTPVPPAQIEYRELYLVGHSLGAPVIRHMLADLGRDAPANADPRRQRILRDARLRLFSPAIGGFFPSGMLGTLVEMTKRAEPMLMANDPAYKALGEKSDFLRILKTNTEGLAKLNPDLAAFRAQTLWANPDRVVKHENYAHDDTYSIDRVSHSSVCKPSQEQYPLPWHFVENGDTPPVVL
jgi:hypothetical protein